MADRARLDAYLERIGYDGPVNADLDTLRGMHRAHFLNVPFENLNIQRQVPIVVDTDQNFEKIVTRHRGGFCLELAGLFAWALREIGFDVDILAGRFMYPGGFLSEPGSHMVLAVHLDEDWIADVGAGGRIAQPLRFDERGPQTTGATTCAVDNEGEVWFVTIEDPWTLPTQPRTYVFTRQPRAYEEFTNVCHWLQTSEDSSFTRGDMVTRSHANGRTTYAGGRLIQTDGDQRTETPVTPEALPATLRDHFGITL